MEILAMILIGLGVANAEAATINAASCNSVDVQSAINSAVDGDMVNIPAGNCTWSNQVAIPNTKGIKLEGSGQGVTTIVDNVIPAPGQWAGMVLITAAPTNSVVEVGKFTIEGNGNGYAKITVIGAGLDRYRVHDITINNNNGTGMFQMPDFDGTNELSGLWDHITCNALTGSHCIQMQGANATSGQGQFTRPIQFGSNHMTYIEDCTIDYTQSPSDGGADNYNGARVVERYNTVINTELTGAGHGADSAYRGVHSYETYRNTFSNTLQDWSVTNNRSGVGLEFENDATGLYSKFNYTIYRIPEAQPLFPAGWTMQHGWCDGTSSWDGNLGATGRPAGYPYLDQQGWFFGPGPAGLHGLNKARPLDCLHAKVPAASYRLFFMSCSASSFSPSSIFSRSFSWRNCVTSPLLASRSVSRLSRALPASMNSLTQL